MVSHIWHLTSDILNFDFRNWNFILKSISIRTQKQAFQGSQRYSTPFQTFTSFHQLELKSQAPLQQHFSAHCCCVTTFGDLHYDPNKVFVFETPVLAAINFGGGGLSDDLIQQMKFRFHGPPPLALLRCMTRQYRVRIQCNLMAPKKLVTSTVCKHFTRVLDNLVDDVPVDNHIPYEAHLVVGWIHACKCGCHPVPDVSGARCFGFQYWPLVGL